MSYNYETNILELSETDDIKEVPKEWISLAPSCRMEQKERCICNRGIIIVERFFNTKTKRVINVGTTCVKELRLNKCKSINSVIKSFIDGETGEYNQIIDLIKYSDDNLQKVIATVKEMTNSLWNNPDGLIEIKRIISILSENGIDCPELKALLSDLQKRIDCRAQLAETHRLWTEKMNREYAERAEEQRVISEARRREEDARIERQREADKIVQEKNRLAQLEELRYRESLRDPMTLKRLQREADIRAYNAKKLTT
jgi:hypothetical protein